MTFRIKFNFMIIDIIRTSDLNLPGIYKIINKANNKYYIGSTQESFIIRWKHHINALRRGSHKNLHLQNAFNKYGENSFVFTILETCSKKNCLIREQFYLDKIDENSYNINPLATSLCKTPETIQKQIESRKSFYKECLPWYIKLKNNEITFEQIPKRFQCKIKSLLDCTPWNKGKPYESTNHLKVPHKKSDRSNCKITMRTKALTVYVYDENLNFLDSFRSAKDLEELSLILNLPIKSRFAGDRMGVPKQFLNSGNINKAIKTNSKYKGLIFTNKPLHPGMDDKNQPKSVNVWNDNTEVNN